MTFIFYARLVIFCLQVFLNKDTCKCILDMKYESNATCVWTAQSGVK